MKSNDFHISLIFFYHQCLNCGSSLTDPNSETADQVEFGRCLYHCHHYTIIIITITIITIITVITIIITITITIIIIIIRLLIR